MQLFYWHIKRPRNPIINLVRHFSSFLFEQLFVTYIMIIKATYFMTSCPSSTYFVEDHMENYVLFTIFYIIIFSLLILHVSDNCFIRYLLLFIECIIYFIFLASRTP